MSIIPARAGTRGSMPAPSPSDLPERAEGGLLAAGWVRVVVARVTGAAAGSSRCQAHRNTVGAPWSFPKRVWCGASETKS
eukprot:scaffold103471_cov72-Phaeocystis_antarctica.AAC.1